MKNLNSHPSYSIVFFPFCDAPAVTKYADNDFLGHRPYNTVAQTYGGYTWETYRQINQRVNAFGSGIMHLNEVILGNEQLNRWSLGIWSHGRPEWFITEMSCNTYNLISVALYDTLGADAVEYIVNHADIQIVVSSGKDTHYSLLCVVLQHVKFVYFFSIVVIFGEPFFME
jgi:long-chain acyl-CoA synthetase